MDEYFNSSFSIDNDSLFSIGYDPSYPEAERKLLVAILERAILDFIGTDRREMQEASYWFLNDDDSFLSFDWICTELSINKDTFIRKLSALPKREKRPIKVAA
jgi:hypothetical protein